MGPLKILKCKHTECTLKKSKDNIIHEKGIVNLIHQTYIIINDTGIIQVL